jgi:TolB-like protein/predicted Ser/Thr protein kinase
MTLVGSKILHYQILSEIGAGGMGVVYLAEDEKLHRKVALKFINQAIQDDPGSRERLVREARAASRLNHPNIVAIHAIEETPEHIFIVMEFVEGESLRDIVRRGEMTWERAVELAPPILSALAMAHEHGLVHRDIKSDNILLTPKGQPKVLDFGLARDHEPSAFVTSVGSSAGTPAYMSPEQVQESEVDQRSDLFSFGVVLYELATGRMPFKGQHQSAVTYSIVNEQPAPIASINKSAPAGLQTIISKLLEKNPKDRYQTATEAMQDLGSLRAGARVAGRGGQRRMRVVAAVMVAVVAAGAWFFTSRDRVHSTLIPEANAGRKMLAVLPFENLGPTDQEYFADGITEEITTHLAGLSGLGVISRTSAVKYKGSGKSLRDIGKELGVEYALEGSVRWDKSSGQNNVRISVQLIHIDDDTHLWADNFDRVYEQIFTLQSEIAERVARELNVTLLEPERVAMAERPTENLEAYDLYMRGRAQFDRAMQINEMDEGLALVEQAVALDSTFAEAQGFLARRYANQYFNAIHSERPRLKEARSAALAAARHSAPGQPHGHLAMGYYHYYGSRDYENALKEFAIAGKMQPNNVEVLEAIAFVQRRQGRWEEAVANLERAIQLDPSNLDRISNMMQTLTYMRRWDDVERYIERGLALSPDDVRFKSYRALIVLIRDGKPQVARDILVPIADQHAAIRGFLVETDIMSRDYAAVERHLPNLAAAAGGDTIDYYMNRAQAYHFAGNDRRALTYADSALTFMNARRYREKGLPQRLMGWATASAMLGHKQEAFAAIDEAVEKLPVERDAMAGVDMRAARCIVYIVTGEHDKAIEELEFLMSVPSTFTPAILRIHPGVDSLRDDPRFQKLAQEKLSS